MKMAIDICPYDYPTIYVLDIGPNDTYHTSLEKIICKTNEISSKAFTLLEKYDIDSIYLDGAKVYTEKIKNDLTKEINTKYKKNIKIYLV